MLKIITSSAVKLGTSNVITSVTLNVAGDVGGDSYVH